MPGPSIAERMAALMKPEGGGGQSPASEKSPPEAKGKRLHAGLVERETVVVGMVRYAKRFAVLYSDPLLAFFTDGSGSVLKNSRSLAGCAVTVEGQAVTLSVPNEKPIKLRTATDNRRPSVHSIGRAISARPVPPDRGVGDWLITSFKM